MSEMPMCQKMYKESIAYYGTTTIHPHIEDFQEDIHYFVAEGENLKPFDILSERTSNLEEDISSSLNNDILSKRTSKRGGARKRYLWTLKGAFVHAWILKSPSAKTSYEKLMGLAENPQVHSDVQQEVTRLNALVAKLQDTVDMYIGALNHAADENQKLKNQKRQTGLPPTSVMDIEMILNRLRRRLKEERLDTKAIMQDIAQLDAKVSKTLEIEESSMEDSMKQAEFRSTIQEQFAQLTQPITLPLLESPR